MDLIRFHSLYRFNILNKIKIPIELKYAWFKIQYITRKIKMECKGKSRFHKNAILLNILYCKVYLEFWSEKHCREYIEEEVKIKEKNWIVYISARKGKTPKNQWRDIDVVQKLYKISETIPENRHQKMRVGRDRKCSWGRKNEGPKSVFPKEIATYISLSPRTIYKYKTTINTKVRGN